VGRTLRLLRTLGQVSIGTVRGTHPTLAGLNYSKSPNSGSESFFNQLTPEKQVTLGGTWQFDKRSEMSVFYMPVFDNILGGYGGEQSMYHNSFGVSYGWHF